jgi:hypothetical protein
MKKIIKQILEILTELLVIFGILFALSFAHDFVIQKQKGFLRDKYTFEEMKERLISSAHSYDPSNTQPNEFSIYGGSGKLYYIEGGWNKESTRLIPWNYMEVLRKDAIDIILGAMLQEYPMSGFREIRDYGDYVFIKNVLESCTDDELEWIFWGKIKVKCVIVDLNKLDKVERDVWFFNYNQLQQKAQPDRYLKRDLEWIRKNILNRRRELRS